MPKIFRPTHSTVYLLIGLALPSLAAMLGADALAALDENRELIRKFTVEVDPIAGSQWSATPGARVARNERELTKLLGKAIAKQIAGQIDFGKEDLVHVSWGSSGPPFGTLQYEIKEGKKGKIITFYVKEPNADIRGQAFRVGNDFFAVPKESRVSFKGSH